MRKLLALAALLVATLVTGQAEARSSWVSFQPQVRDLGCLRPKTRAMIGQLTRRIGPIQITSTCGGRHARNSQHYRGNAIDFRPLATSTRGALAALRAMPIVGGIGSYSGGLIHADVGDRVASWHGRSRSRFAKFHRHRHRYASHRHHYHRYAYRPFYRQVAY